METGQAIIVCTATVQEEKLSMNETKCMESVTQRVATYEKCVGNTSYQYNLILDLSYIVRRGWELAVNCDPRQLPSEPISKKEAQNTKGGNPRQNKRARPTRTDTTNTKQTNKRGEQTKQTKEQGFRPSFAISNNRCSLKGAEL